MIYKFTYMYDYKDMSHCPQKIVGEEKLEKFFSRCAVAHLYYDSEIRMFRRYINETI